MHDQANIDWDLCLKAAMGNQDIATEMLSKIVDSLPAELNAIEASFQAEDYQQLEFVVHKLHGVCHYTGLPQLKSAAKNLEVALIAKEYDKLSSLVKNLCHCIKSVISEHQDFPQAG